VSSGYDIILRAPPGGNGITLRPPPPAAADPGVTIVLNDPTSGSGDMTLRPPDFRDGVPTHRNANLVGQRATTRFQSFSYPVELVGQRATAISGYLPEWFLIDFFTGSNGTALDARSMPDSNTWWLQNAPTVGTQAHIQSNRVIANGGTDFLYYNNNFFDQCPYTDNTYGEAVLRYEGNNGATMAGITMFSFGIPGYYFGWNDSTLNWELGYGWSGGGLVQLVSDATNAFSGTVGETHTIGLEVYTDGATSYITCYVDGVATIQTTDFLNVTTGTVGLVFGSQLSGVPETASVSIDSVKFGVIRRVLTGGLATTGFGTITPSITSGSGAAATGNLATAAAGTIVPEDGVTLTGLVAVTGYGSLSLVGQRAVTSAGVFDSTTIDKEFTGLVATSGAGTLTGLGENFQALIGTNLGVTGGTFPGAGTTGGVTSATVRAPGLHATQNNVGINITTGTTALVSFAPQVPKIDVVVAAQGFNSHEAPTWAPYFTYPQDFARITGIDNTGRETLGYYSLTATKALSFTTFLTDMGVPGANVPMQIGARATTTIGTMVPTTGVDKAKELIGKAATTSQGMLLRDPADLNVNYDVPLVGQSTIASACGYASNFGGAALLLSTTNTSKLTKAVAVQFLTDTNSLNNIHPYGDVLRIAEPTPDTTICLIPPAAGNNIVMRPVWNSDPADYIQALVAYVPPPTSWDQSTVQNYWTIVPSGYGDITYCVYTTYLGIGVAVIDVGTRTLLNNTFKKYNIAAISPILGNATSANPPPVAYVVKLSNGRSVTQFFFGACVVNLTWTKETSGVPQIALKALPNVSMITFDWNTLEVRGDEVVHMVAHTSEAFADMGREYLDVVYANDATTSADGPWVSNATSFSVAPNPITVTIGSPISAPVTVDKPTYQFINGHWVLSWLYPDYTGFHSGYGPVSDYGAWPYRYPVGFSTTYGTWLYRIRERDQPYLNADPRVYDDPASLFVKYWSAQPFIYTVSAAGRVGRVDVVVTPNALPLGLSVSAYQGNFALILAGPNITVGLVGRKITATGGLATPPVITFLKDTFTDTVGTALTAHVGEIGATWTDPQGFVEIQSTVARTNPAGAYSRPYPVGVSDRLDYKVQWHWSPNYGGTHNGGVPDFAVGVRCNDNPSGTDHTGYFFGYNGATQYAYLFKPAAGISPVVGARDIGFVLSTDLWEIEVRGISPTKVICRINGKVVFDWDDYGTNYLTYGDEYSHVGNVAMWFGGNSFSNSAGSILDIQGTYIDPSAFFIDGLRAFTGAGSLSGPWPTGQRAVTSYGALTPVVEYVGALTGLMAGVLVPDGGTIWMLPPPAGNDIILRATSRTVQGKLFPVQAAGALTGQVATTGFGTLGVTGASTTSVGLIGQRATMAPGVIGLLNRELPGLVATLRRGDLGWQVDAYPTPTGLRLNTASGLFGVNMNIFPLGRSAAMAAGVLTLASGVREFGAQATTGAGLLTPSTAVVVALTGQAASCTPGVLSPATAEGATLAGQVATAGFGTLVPVISRGLVGASVVTSAGVLVPLIVVTPLGRAAVTAQGTMALLLNIFLTGRSGTLVQGTVGQTHGCTVTPQGVYTKGEVGSVNQRFRPEQPSSDLWATTTPTELTKVDEVVDVFS